MKKNTGSSGLGLSSVLTIIFVVLKLVGTINWSWWWVFSPILIDIVLVTIILIGCDIYRSREIRNMRALKRKINERKCEENEDA